ncbi:MAG: hypothetical protein PSV46_15125 [Reyranella sp.]|nr:hypothetical protein [Reyranella sp.]
MAKHFLFVAAVAAVALANVGSANVASAQIPAYPPAGYSPLLFDPTDTKYVFRLNGTPWICRGDTFCKPLKIEGVADRDLPQATIEPLGFAGPRYFLSYRQANVAKGTEIALSCIEERCSRLDSTVGDATGLGTYTVKQGNRAVTRTAILRRLEAKNGRAQLLWCTETDCSELPLTRDSENYLSYMGSGRADGRSLAWLRNRSGAVLSCAQPEEGTSDQIVCEKSKIVLSDFPATTPVAAAAPAPPPAPPPAASPPASDAERAALAASIDRAISSGDFLTAGRQLADATRRYPGHAAWPPLQQKLAKAHADYEARRLIAEARRFAQAGDFTHAEAMLAEAEKQDPGFAEIAQARTEIAALRTERGQRYRERLQYYTGIDQALAAGRLWEAERLLAEYTHRFGQDDEYRARANRLAQMRAGGDQQARINEARAHIQAARQAWQQGNYAEVDRQLAAADRAAPGFPEVTQARADLNRRPGLTITIPGLQLPGSNQPPPAPRN